MNDKRIGAATALIVCGLALTVLAYFYLEDGRVGAADAQRNLARIQALKEEIVRLRSQENQAVMADESSDLSISDLLPIAEQAGINESQLKDPRALTTRAFPDSPYRYEDLQIRLTNVLAEQVAKFSVAAENASEGCQVSLLRMDAQTLNQLDGPELWNATLILTRLVYDAKTPNGA
ncbi:MAG: hypothetical protein AAGG44_13140 [Planctomycetota bacterium]